MTFVNSPVAGRLRRSAEHFCVRRSGKVERRQASRTDYI